MTRPAPAANPQPPPEPVNVTVRPAQGGENGVFEITVQVDDKQAASTQVRTSPRRFAFPVSE
jgi:hypothetical protein